MTVIPFPAHRRHWRRREPLSVRAALLALLAASALFWLAVASLVRLVFA